MNNRPAPGSPNPEHQKALAIIFCLFMLLLYKQTIWDPYFHPPAQVAPKPAPKQAAPVDYGNDAYEEPGAPAPQASTAPAPAPIQAQLPAPGSPPPQGYPTDGQVKSVGVVVVQTRDYSAGISLLGGRVTEFFLNNYKETLDHPEKKLNMVDHVEKAPLPLGIYSGTMNDAWVQYRIVSGIARGAAGNYGPLELAADGTGEIVLEGQFHDGRTIRKTLKFAGTGFTIDVAAKVSAPSTDAARVSLEWTKLIPKDSPRLLDPYQTSSFVWFDGQKALREDVTKLPAEPIELSPLRWVSLSDKYFMVALITPGDLLPAKIMKSGDLYRGRMSGSETAVSAQVFVGPKNLELLKSMGFELKRDINFGKTALIAAPLASLLHWLFGILGNYGLAIIVLTIIVKICLHPLTASSYKQMKGMQDLAPELAKIKESITDKQQQQLAMMQLYKTKNVNPLGGCLPIFLQMPVFFGLFSALQLSIELRHAPFAFWIHDLSAPEKLMVGGISLPVMVVLFVISMLIQQWTTPTTLDATQKKIMLAMPLVFGFMFAGMPAGLTLYWLTNNTISICQQIGLRKGGIKHALGLTLGSSLGVFLFAWALVQVSAKP